MGKKIGKKTLVLVLIAVMSLLLSSQAFAAEPVNYTNDLQADSVMMVEIGSETRYYNSFANGWFDAQMEDKKSATNSVTVTLLADWEADANGIFPGTSNVNIGRLAVGDANLDITIDLNGQSIDRKLDASKKRGNGQIFHVSAGILTITDSEGNGTITGASTIGGGGAFYVNGGQLIINGGTISGNYCSGNGGGIACVDNGSVVINGGTITDNTAGNGGGVYHNGVSATVSN